MKKIDTQDFFEWRIIDYKTCSKTLEKDKLEVSWQWFVLIK